MDVASIIQWCQQELPPSIVSTEGAGGGDLLQAWERFAATLGLLSQQAASRVGSGAAVLLLSAVLLLLVSAFL